MMDSEPDWQQAPDSDSSASPLSDSHDVPPETGSLSLKERLMEALKEQQQDYSQGKIPQDPVDETQASALNGESVINQTAAFKTEKIFVQGIKKSPSALTHGDSEKDVQ